MNNKIAIRLVLVCISCVLIVTVIVLLMNYFNIKNIDMKKNMGTADRVIRILLAAVFAYLYFGGIVTGTAGIVLAVLGAVFVLTSLVSFCPLYTLFGLSTCPAKKAA